MRVRSRLVKASVVGALAFAPRPVLAELPAASWIGKNDQSVLRSVSPKGLELLEQAEQARLAGDHERALALYARADDVYKMREEPQRFACRLLTDLGRKNEAVAACKSAVEKENSDAALRALVGAQMAGEGPLSMDELSQVERVTRALLQRGRNEPWGYAAKADIARRIGDSKMLETALLKLRQVAPGHYETTRLERLSKPGGGAFALLLWLLLPVALIATGIHASFRRLRPRPGRGGAQAAALLVVVLAARGASAQEVVESPSSAAVPGEGANVTHGLSKWGVDNDDPEKSLPSAAQRDHNPLEYGYHLMDLGERADLAISKGDYAGAIKYYRALSKAVPDMAISWAKMCEQYEKLGRRDEALDACGTALAKNGPRLQDYELYGKVMFSGRGKLTPDEVTNLGTMIDHLRAQPQEAAQTLGAKLECDLGLRTDDLERLERCTAALAKSAPDAPTTVTYQWSFAMQQKRYDDALALIERAKKVGVPAAGVAKMGEATRDALPLWRQPLRFALVAAVALGAIVAIVILVRRRRPVSAAPAVPVTAASS